MSDPVLGEAVKTESPPPKRYATKWRAVMRTVYENPGQWFVVLSDPNDITRARNTMKWLKHKSKRVLMGDRAAWAFTTRNGDLYARYDPDAIGEEMPE